MLLEKNILHLYTDGSSYSKPRRGGYAARFVYLEDSFEEKIEDFEYPGVLGATNNQMELFGCIKGLEEAMGSPKLQGIDSIIVFTDSMYVVRHYKDAIFQWPTTRWMGREGPILNVGLWKELVKKIKQLSSLKVRVIIKWVQGHSKNIHNRAVDKMAKKSAQNCISPAMNVVTVRRKQFKEVGKSETIKPSGQKFTIKIFTCEYLKHHKLYKYKYEVVSKKNEYYKRGGLIYFKDALWTRHSYLVTLSDDPNKPFISKIHKVYKRPDEIMLASQPI